MSVKTFLSKNLLGLYISLLSAYFYLFLANRQTVDISGNFHIVSHTVLWSNSLFPQHFLNQYLTEATSQLYFGIYFFKSTDPPLISFTCSFMNIWKICLKSWKVFETLRISFSFYCSHDEGGKRGRGGGGRGIRHGSRWFFLLNHASRRNFLNNHASRKKY